MWEVIRDNFIAGIPGLFIGFSLGLLSLYHLGYSQASRFYQQEAIYRGYGQICPNSGKWSWINECKVFEIDFSKVTIEDRLSQ